KTTVLFGVCWALAAPHRSIDSNNDFVICSPRNQGSTHEEQIGCDRVDRSFGLVGLRRKQRMCHPTSLEAQPVARRGSGAGQQVGRKASVSRRGRASERRKWRWASVAPRLLCCYGSSSRTPI